MPTKTELSQTGSRFPDQTDSNADLSASLKKWRYIAFFLGLSTLGLIIAVILEAVGKSSKNETKVVTKTVTVTPDVVILKPPVRKNPCEGKNPELPDVQCVIDQVVQTGEQACANVTKGYQGNLETDAVPILKPFYQVGLCPVNVHWHLGTESYSLGQFDERGKGPQEESVEDNNEEHRRGLSGAQGEVRQGFRCHYYDEQDPKFTTEYQWQYCKDMKVGETYEVHWPHSAAGACGTPDQFQSPFYDGVFCRDDVLTDTASQVGVQGQVFTIVNDESYFYPDLMHGMIIDGKMGADVAKYTGSTTGTPRSNEICSQYSPITWHVDRNCHLISASSFDKLCADMMSQRDDMTEDMEPHGARELVSDDLAANNQHLRH